MISVHAAISEEREEPSEGDAVQDARPFAHVYAGGAPELDGLRERRRSLRLTESLRSGTRRAANSPTIHAFRI